MTAAPCCALRGIVAAPLQYRSASTQRSPGRGSLPGLVVNTTASSSSVACQAWYWLPEAAGRVVLGGGQHRVGRPPGDRVDVTEQADVDLAAEGVGELAGDVAVAAGD